MKFNMLEVLNAQVLTPDMPAFGKGFYSVRDRIKNDIESHAPSGASQVDILILSDLWSRSGLDSNPPEDTEGVRLLQDLITAGHDEAFRRIQAYLRSFSVSVRWARKHEPETYDAGHFDLHAIYTLLADLGERSGKSWRIDRTVYADPPAISSSSITLRIETTVLGVERDSIFWDSNTPLIGDCDNRYDLILLRRGLCYCGRKKLSLAQAACCGAARQDGTDASFLLKVSRALRSNDRSAAYLAGWNTPVNTRSWRLAIAEANVNATVVNAYDELQQRVPSHLRPYSSGIFLSRGRRMPTNMLTM